MKIRAFLAALALAVLPAAALAQGYPNKPIRLIVPFPPAGATPILSRQPARTSAQRSPLLPELPTVAGSVPGFESTTWSGVFGPKGMSPDVVQRLNTEIKSVPKSPEFRERLKALGYDAAGGSPSDFARVVANDSAKWARLIKERKITAD